jgi:hypothetical protein
MSILLGLGDFYQIGETIFNPIVIEILLRNVYNSVFFNKREKRMEKMKKVLAVMLVFVFALAAVGSSTYAVSASGGGQQTCPSGGDWTKVDGLSGTSYTFNAPNGYLVAETCYKASTTVVYGAVNPPAGSATVTSSVTNQNGNVQDLSHASFRLVTVPPDPEVCKWDPTLLADDPLCVPPDPEVCEWDETLPADDPLCVPPEPPKPPKPPYVPPAIPYTPACDEGCGSDYTVEFMTHPEAGNLHIMWTLVDKCTWTWSCEIDGWLFPWWEIQRVYMFSPEEFSIIYRDVYIPATMVDGQYFLSAPPTGDFIILAGIHSGPFTWAEWPDLVRIRDAGVLVSKFTSCSGLELGAFEMPTE